MNNENVDRVRLILVGMLNLFLGAAIAFGSFFVCSFFFFGKAKNLDSMYIALWMALKILPIVPWAIGVIICFLAYRMILGKRFKGQCDKIKEQNDAEINQERQRIRQKELQLKEAMQKTEAQREEYEADYKRKCGRYRIEIDAVRSKNRLLQMAFKNPGRAKRAARQSKINLELD